MLVLLKRNFYATNGVLYISHPSDPVEIPESMNGEPTAFPKDAMPADEIAKALLKERIEEWKTGTQNKPCPRLMGEAPKPPKVKKTKTED